MALDLDLIEELLVDERVYCLINRARWERIEAMGVKIGPQHYVGPYMFWNNVPDPCLFLKEAYETFGEVQLYSPNKEMKPGLVCKWSAYDPFMLPLNHHSQDFKRIQLELLEIRAKNPKPFLSLYQHDRRNFYPLFLPQLSCIDSNYYGFIPN